jgi:hypothetical protein
MIGVTATSPILDKAMSRNRLIIRLHLSVLAARGLPLVSPHKPPVGVCQLANRLSTSPTASMTFQTS